MCGRILSIRGSCGKRERKRLRFLHNTKKLRLKLRANVVEQKIFEIEDLKELEEFLQSQSEIEQLRERLFAEFLKYADYKNAGEWNKAVRLCESLAIIGWGNHEALEALRG